MIKTILIIIQLNQPPAFVPFNSASDCLAAKKQMEESMKQNKQHGLANQVSVNCLILAEEGERV